MTEQVNSTVVEKALEDSIETRAFRAGLDADSFIREEVERQDVMWGVANDRADATAGQMAAAAMAQIGLVLLKDNNVPEEVALQITKQQFYPQTWGGFRSYGSDVANLVVAAAYLRQEIKRRIVAGEDTTRSSRDLKTQPYEGDQPKVVLS